MSTAQKQGHTKGPWKVYEDGNMLWVGPIDADEPTVCDLSPHGEEGILSLEDDANAEFIVRACNVHDELLSHLKDCFEELQLQGVSPENDAMKAIATAIAKAEAR